MPLVRLNKYLAQQGVASRRAVDRLLGEGLIAVNGKKVQELGLKIDPAKDQILIEGKPLKKSERLVYIALHKPLGFVTSAKPTPQAPRIVLDLIQVPERVFPVGRLDKDTSGLLLLTNDGALAFQLSHPSFECEKEYEIEVLGPLTAPRVLKLEEGVRIGGIRTNPARVTLLGPTRMRMTIKEGRNRQIRRMCEKVGIEVKALKRLRIKTLTLGSLALGKWRFLTKEEVRSLKA